MFSLGFTLKVRIMKVVFHMYMFKVLLFCGATWNFETTRAYSIPSLFLKLGSIFSWVKFKIIKTEKTIYSMPPVA